MLEQLSKNLWICNGDSVPFYGLPYSTRMTVIRLANDELFIHSPIKADSELVSQVSKLGKVKFLIPPNKIHHLFLQDWAKIFPDAKVYASPGLRKKRKDINFTVDLKDFSEPE